MPRSVTDGGAVKSCEVDTHRVVELVIHCAVLPSEPVAAFNVFLVTYLSSNYII